MKKYLSIILIIGVAFSIFLTSFLNKDIPDSIPLKFTEATFFDPICEDKQIFTIDYEPLCVPHTQWSESLGASGNIDDVRDRYQTHLKTYFLKIDLSDLPKEDFLNQINIVDAKLTLNSARYDESVTPEIAIYNGLCPETSWSMTTHIEKLPCVNDDKQIDMMKRDFSEYKMINDLTIHEIEIKEHIEYALKENLNSFTELIQFYPLQFKINGDFTPQQRFCLYNNVTYVYDIENCIKENRAGLYSVEHPVDGLRPSLVVSYKITPTDFGRLLNSIIAFIPAITTTTVTILKDRTAKIREEKDDLRSDNSKNEKKILKAKISNVFIITTLAVGGVLILISIVGQIPIKNEWDVSNWATLVVEVGIGAAIASAILIYESNQQKKTKEQQDKITDVVNSIKKIEEKQKEFLGELEKTRNARISFYGTKLVNSFEQVQKCFNDLENLPDLELQKLNPAFFDKFKPAHVIQINVQNQNIEFTNLPFFIVMKEDLHIIEPDLPPEISFFAGRTLEMAQFCLVPLSGKIQIGDGLWKVVKEDMPKVIDRLNSLIVDKKPLKEYGVRFYRTTIDTKL